MKKIPVILLALCLAFSLSACAPSASAQSEQAAAAVLAGEGDEGGQESGGPAGTTRVKAVRGLAFEVETADPQDMSPAFDTGSISVNAKLFQKDGGGWGGQLNITRIKPQAG